MKSKGIALTPSSTMVQLIMIGVIVLLFVLFYTHYIDVHTIAQEAGVENDAINLAQVIIGNQRLISSDLSDLNDPFAHRFRAVLDKSKLDSILTKGSVDQSNFLSTPSALPELGYPNSYGYTVIVDLETNEVWSTTISGPLTSSPFDFATLKNCLLNNVKIDFSYIFRIPSLSPWEIWDLQKCSIEFASRTGTSIKGFPVAIKDSTGNVHIGRLTVGLMEW